MNKPMPKKVQAAFLSFEGDLNQTIQAINNCVRVRKEKWRWVYSEDLSDYGRFVTMMRQHSYIIAANYMMGWDTAAREMIPLVLFNWLNKQIQDAQS